MHERNMSPHISLGWGGRPASAGREVTALQNMLPHCHPIPDRLMRSGLPCIGGRRMENAMAKDDPKSSLMANAIGNPEVAHAGGASVSDLHPQIAYTDLREWIKEARKLGEIRDVKELSWQTDIGQAAEVVLHDENAPCVVFEDIPGTLAGSKVLVNFFGGRRQRMTLGFPLHLSKLELSEAFRAHYMADLKRIPPRYVNDGPVFENVITGDKVDITIFPAPKWHPDDGG